MKVSVVTVSFNGAATIRFTLDSFAAQRHPLKELIVIDGGSTDETVTIAESYAADNVSVFSERDSGIYDAMNRGLANFGGDAVGFLNSDDAFVDGNVLGDIADALAVSEIVYGHIEYVRDHKDASVVRRWRSCPHRPGSFRRGWMPPHPTFYVRRPVVDTVGQFNVRYRIAADYDWMLRALELNAFRSKMIDKVLVRMMTGGASTGGVRAVIQHNCEALHSRRTWLHNGFVDRAFFMKPLRKLPQLLVR